MQDAAPALGANDGAGRPEAILTSAR
jgi:hypothetical protein